MTSLSNMRTGLLILAWSTTLAVAFQARNSRLQQTPSLYLSSSDHNGGPTFPSPLVSQDSDVPPLDDSNSITDTTASEGQANTRFSKFAPDLDLDAEEFRLQLRENMKADLERRRNEDPNRGNQIAKSYLDSL